MNINIDLNKIFRFILILSMIAGGLIALGSIYAAYIIDQQVKIDHYNKALGECMKTPGAIVKYEASTPFIGSGNKMSCEWVNPNFIRM